MKTAVCTIVTRNRLHLARVVMNSVATHFPAAERHVLVIDPPAGAGSSAPEPFEVTPATDAVLPRFLEFAFVNDVLSLACLLKPAFARHLLRARGCDRVIYLDSDTCMYAPPDSVMSALEQAPFVLTPHATHPAPVGAARSDADFVRSGVFNAGFFAARNDPEALRFLDWWTEAMARERCLDAFCCRDQLWLNLVPVLFPSVHVLRSPGVNVGYWNLHEQPITRRADGTYLAGDVRLALFHFSQFDPAQPSYVSHRHGIDVPAPNRAVASLLEEYAALLIAAGASTCLAWPYGHACFSDGTPISAAQRRYYLDCAWGERERVGSPFDPDFTAGRCRGFRSVYGFHRLLPTATRRVNRLLRAGLAAP